VLSLLEIALLAIRDFLSHYGLERIALIEDFDIGFSESLIVGALME
jgi:hypothetical protein